MACPICPHTLNSHRQTVLRPAQANAYSSLSLRQILPPIWVVVGTIHGLMPSPSNPCPVGQGYMAVHQGTHNTARFIALPYGTVSRGEECGMPPSTLPGQKASPPPKLRAQDQLAGRKLINLVFFTKVSARAPFPQTPFLLCLLWVPTNSSIWV